MFIWISIKSKILLLDPCFHHEIAVDSSRLINNSQKIPLLCDGNFQISNWIRFKTDNMTDAIIINQCMPLLSCQTLSPGWIVGSHPTGGLPIMLMLD